MSTHVTNQQKTFTIMQEYELHTHGNEEKAVEKDEKVWL